MRDVKRQSLGGTTGRQGRMWSAAVVLLAAMLSPTPAAPHPAPVSLTHPGWVNPPLLAAPTPPRSVDPPLRMSVRDAQGASLRGAITGFDPAGFLFQVRGESEPRRLGWALLSPARVYTIHERLLDRDDGEGWLRLGAALYARAAPGPGEKALAVALRADAGLAGRAERARQGEPLGEPEAGPQAGEGEETQGDAPTQNQAEASAPAGRKGPVSRGATQEMFWGTLTNEIMTSSTSTLLEEVRAARKSLSIDLKVYQQSEYYLFVSDLPGSEAQRWLGLLDRLYHRMCDTFAVTRGTNVFRGKCLVYVFRREADYQRFHNVVSGINVAGTAGLCKSYGNGQVEITAYQQRDRNVLAHVLAHEVVHGFLHRYRSHPFVVSWINEGLAEFVAADLIGLYRPREVRERVARSLTLRGGTSGMLSDAMIEGWQYPVAQALCDFMIAQDRGRYRDFVNAIKDGKPWRKALAEDYGVSQVRLLGAFGQALGLPGLRN